MISQKALFHGLFLQTFLRQQFLNVIHIYYCLILHSDYEARANLQSESILNPEDTIQVHFGRHCSSLFHCDLTAGIFSKVLCIETRLLNGIHKTHKVHPQVIHPLESCGYVPSLTIQIPTLILLWLRTSSSEKFILSCCPKEC